MSAFTKLGMVIAAALLIAISGCGGESSEDESAALESDKPATPEEELIEALSEAIALAEAHKIEELFERFSPPEDYLRLKESGELAVAVKRFDIFRFDFVRAMREAQTIQPAFNEDTTRAVYEIVEVEVPGHKVAFQKIDDIWYFSD